MEETKKSYKAARMENLEGIQLTASTYNLVIGAVILWGVAINMLMSRFLTGYILGWHYAAVLILFLAGSLGGSLIVYGSKNPVISFVGFTIMAFGMGILLSYYLTLYTSASVFRAFLMTGIVTLAMMALSMVFPNFFLSIGRGLFIGLLLAIVADVIAAFIFRTNVTAIDYIIIVIFCGYIGFDWARAQVYPKNLDNAVDSAADIYMDVVNLFIRILAVSGKRK